MATRRRSASRNQGWTRSVKRDILTGGRGRGRRSRPSAALPLLLGRLRRLELAVLYLTGDAPKFDLDSFRQAVLSLPSDAELEESWRSVRRGEVQVPQQRTTDREGEGAFEDAVGREGRNDGPPPFPPGPPDGPEDES